MTHFDLYLQQCSRDVEAFLDQSLPPETTRPTILHQAMRYSLFAGGKRLRPALCFAACEACGGEADKALRPAAALEALHTYTLIHDDLPAMDNDDLRRGKPTCHKVYGEANAILAGDALLTFAFQLLADSEIQPAHMVMELAKAAGSTGVIAGQIEDMANEGKSFDETTLRFIHRHKTGDLIRASVRLGVIASGNEQPMKSLSLYADHIGLAFQIADDVLNATSDPETLGKAVGSDTERGKQTFVALMGLEKARAEAERLVQEAVALLEQLPGPTAPLHDLAWHIIHRDR